jgi:hypothetical protein
MTKTQQGSRFTKRVGVYLRVSASEQTTTNQRRELYAVAKRHGWSVVQVFEDAGISGAKGRNDRPALDALLKSVARRDRASNAVSRIQVEDRSQRRIPPPQSVDSEVDDEKRSACSGQTCSYSTRNTFMTEVRRFQAVNSARSAFASFRSRVSNPSVNQP